MASAASMTITLTMRVKLLKQQLPFLARSQRRLFAVAPKNQYDLSGSHAIVTGGAQGIGLAVAHRLATSGATLSLWDCDACALEEAAASLTGESRVDTLLVDVTDAEAVTAAMDVQQNAAADILVCSAGITGSNSPVADYSVQEWRRVLDVNLTGVFLCNRAVLPNMTRRGYGRIVNIASVAGKEGNPNAGAYSASKAGVIALTKSIAKETAATGDVAVNCVTPAAAQTRIFDQMSSEHISYMLGKIPRERFLGVHEAASMIAWLVSAENSFTTGAAFDLSGGRATY